MNEEECVQDSEVLKEVELVWIYWGEVGCVIVGAGLEPMNWRCSYNYTVRIRMRNKRFL